MNYREAFLLGDNTKGSYVELGFGKGNSAKLYAEMILNKEIQNRPMWVFDSFSGIPSPSDLDISFDPTLSKGKFATPIQPALDLRFEIPSTEYKVVKGLIENTYSRFSHSHINVLNIDLNTYSSTRLALELFHKFVPKNGVVLVPSYYSNEGVRTAVQDYLSEEGLTHQIKTTNIFVNTQAPSYLTKRTVFKSENDLVEKRVPIFSKVTIEPFKSKVKNERNISYRKVSPSSLLPSIVRDTDLEERRAVKAKATPPTPFEDRYTKKASKKINYVKHIINSARVLMNKVIK